MDVVVCGAQMPFMSGGAEAHQENLVGALRSAGHRADLVRLPVGWEKGRLFDSPLAWRLVPVDADVVIATNFPSYYVRHPAKVVWLFHQHRGAYDAADADWTDIDLSDDALETQRMLVEWDNVALGEATRLYTTSGVVADRLRRYNGLTGTPLYHPPPLHDRLHPGPPGDYVLAVGRLEANKRPLLVVEGLAHAGATVNAVLAGTGSLLESVRRRVHELGVADRIRLPGFVSDTDLVDLYAGALAVVYPPADEDYGYVTLQAFLAGKPVITTEDAGGVLEWVEHGVTGLVTDGTPAAIGAAIDELARDPDRAAALGDAGRVKAAALSWPATVARLLALP